MIQQVVCCGAHGNALAMCMQGAKKSGSRLGGPDLFTGDGQYYLNKHVYLVKPYPCFFISLNCLALLLGDYNA